MSYSGVGAVWCLILASTCLASEIQSNKKIIGTSVGHQIFPKLSPCSPNEDLAPISLEPVNFADDKKVNGDCRVPMRHDGDLWHRVREGLWFQATGSLEFEDDKYTVLSNRLECDPGSLNCALTVSSVVSVSASESWGFSNSRSVSLGVELEKVLTLQASVTEGSSHSYTSATTTSSETSYSCSIPGNHTVYLAARLQYYLIFGYVSEWGIVRREFYVDDNGNIRERDYWGWEERCRPMFRIPKVQPDRSVAGTRRCVVEALGDCASYPRPPTVKLV